MRFEEQNVAELFPKRPNIGRRGMPREWIDAMYQDYLALGSVEKVGKRYGRTRQAIWELFKRCGLKLKEKKFLPKVEFNGMTFTRSLSGRRYYRSTTRRPEVLLHHAVWEAEHGPIPEGYVLLFKNGDSGDCSIENLEVCTRREQQERARDGSNQFTITAQSRLDLLLKSAQGERASVLSRMKRRAA